MIKGSKVFCDNCKKRMMALSEDECLEDCTPHGWSDYRTASVHFCENCHWEIFEDWEPPCYKCRTHRCLRGIECWASPPQQELLPYETYYAERYYRRFRGYIRFLLRLLKPEVAKRQTEEDDIPF